MEFDLFARRSSPLIYVRDYEINFTAHAPHSDTFEAAGRNQHEREAENVKNTR